MGDFLLADIDKLTLLPAGVGVRDGGARQVLAAA